MRWSMNAWEVNFDGLVGLTHNYAACRLVMKPPPAIVFRYLIHDGGEAGLTENESPCRCGIPPAVIPPHERPFIPVLRQLGFSAAMSRYWKKLHARHRTGFPAQLRFANVGSQCGNDRAICRSLDGKVHLTVANLNNKFHRSWKRTSPNHF